MCVLLLLPLLPLPGIHLEGIYRVSPALSLVNRLKAAFDKGTCTCLCVSLHTHTLYLCVSVHGMVESLSSPLSLPLPLPSLSLSCVLTCTCTVPSPPLPPLLSLPLSFPPPPLSDAEAVDSATAEPHVFSAALKLYLRELPVPVITYDLYSDFIAAGSKYGWPYQYICLCVIRCTCAVHE